MTVGEVVAPTSPTKVSTPSAVCREELALVSVTGGEVVNPCSIPRVGVEGSDGDQRRGSE
jgi:hypothetical protein